MTAPNGTKRLSASKKKRRASVGDTRRVDTNALRVITETFTLTDVAPATFSATAHSLPLLVHEGGLTQELKYRAHREPEDNSADTIVAVVEFEYSATTDEALAAEVSGVLAILYVRAGYSGEDFNGNERDMFVEVNGVFHAWPYMRELIQSSMSRLGFPRICLPTYHLPSELPPKGEYCVLTTEPVGATGSE